MADRIISYFPRRRVQTSSELAHSQGEVVEHFHEDTIIAALKQNGWAVIPANRLEQVNAVQLISGFHMLQDPAGATEYESRRIRRMVGELASRSARLKFFNQCGPHKEDTGVFGSVYVVSPSDEEVETWGKPPHFA